MEATEQQQAAIQRA